MSRFISVALVSLLFQASDVETRVIQYLKANVTPGRPVVVSDLYNNVFKTTALVTRRVDTGSPPRCSSSA